MLTIRHCPCKKQFFRLTILTSEVIDGNVIIFVPNFLLNSEVVLGKWNISTETDCLADVCAPPSIRFDVEEIQTDFDDVMKTDDIALLRLSKEVTYSGYIYGRFFGLKSHIRSK